ncbi:hypothetical protein Pmani_020496 [Petrolisthes manimaculis]|uniref:Innexin n=1 Tax=Petrolisthes manimaculis TaxID=1843537 RepID=A0AAE1U2I6_9EUCA|nr:hypothetical protein Pmani_020496 [Petrolisthes manimaculis]
MPAMDPRNILNTVLSFVKSKANHICAGPSDGLVLRMHYRWTFLIMLGHFLVVSHSWYYKKIITCVSEYNADSTVDSDYINICLSYPYVIEDNTEKEKEEENRRYLLFYRWISWTLLGLAGIYYIPRIVSKHFNNTRCKYLLEELAANIDKDDKINDILLKKISNYLIYTLNTHNVLYWKMLLALFIDILAVWLIDILLQGRFILYGYLAYPFTRDPKRFTDYMSQTFPPFVNLSIKFTYSTTTTTTTSSYSTNTTTSSYSTTTSSYSTTTTTTTSSYSTTTTSSYSTTTTSSYSTTTTTTNTTTSSYSTTTNTNTSSYSTTTTTTNTTTSSYSTTTNTNTSSYSTTTTTTNTTTSSYSTTTTTNTSSYSTTTNTTNTTTSSYSTTTNTTTSSYSTTTTTNTSSYSTTTTTTTTSSYSTTTTTNTFSGLLH